VGDVHHVSGLKGASVDNHSSHGVRR
jgi:hypothetical protein